MYQEREEKEIEKGEREKEMGGVKSKIGCIEREREEKKWR